MTNPLTMKRSVLGLLIGALFLAIPYWKGKMFHGKAKKEETHHA